MLKLGSAAALLTSAASAERFALPPELALVLADAEELAAAGLLALELAPALALELELELLDEHAASSIAAPIAVAPNAAEAVR